MYWIIALLWFFLGTIAFWVVLGSRWNKIDPIFQSVLQTSRIFHPVPGEPGYLDLKFSVLRHSIVFLASSAIIFWVKANFILSILLFINVLYCMMSISRYQFRKKDVAEAAMRPNGQATATIIAIPVRDSFCAVVHAVVCVILLYVLYAIRP